MNYLVGYKINTQGSSEGLTIPSGFCIVAKFSVNKALNNGGDDFGSVEIQVTTYKTDSLSDVINTNDDLINQGFDQKGNVKTYSASTDDFNKAVRTLIKNKVLPDLDAAYGSENVVEL